LWPSATRSLWPEMCTLLTWCCRWGHVCDICCFLYIFDSLDMELTPGAVPRKVHFVNLELQVRCITVSGVLWYMWCV
jgi:hypothetical protein